MLEWRGRPICRWRHVSHLSFYRFVEGAAGAGAVGAAGVAGRFVEEPTVVPGLELSAARLLLQGAHMNRRPSTTAAASSIIQPPPMPGLRRSTPVRLLRFKSLRFRSSLSISYSSSNALRCNRCRTRWFPVVRCAGMNAGSSISGRRLRVAQCCSARRLETYWDARAIGSDAKFCSQTRQVVGRCRGHLRMRILVFVQAQRRWIQTAGAAP
jgi:hypothetical protein